MASNNFITNSGTKNLKDRITELISGSEELKFLVGFFYFSGLKELYESLKQNPNVVLKVLVGLNVDIYNGQLVEYAEKEKGLPNNAIVNNFFASVKHSINTDLFDNKESYEQIKFFLDMITSGRLIIRKTLEPNHSKLYIFKLGESQIGVRELFITGSSNLTRPGLTTQQEFNVEIKDYGVDEANAYFEDLWSHAIEVTEKDIVKNEAGTLSDILSKNTLIREITPYEAYALVLKSYLDVRAGESIKQSLKDLFEKNRYYPYQYQLDAVGQALSIIEKNNGVILADVVGLGKTVMACAIASQLKKRGVIICPPGIMGDPHKKDAGWNMYKEQFGLYDWEVWSVGKLEELQQALNGGKLNDVEVVIVDEAHRFRNESTESYSRLHEICRGKTVILLTATPFNNKPRDIYSLLSLFITPHKSTITLSNSLKYEFDEYDEQFKKLSYILKNYNSSIKDNKEKAFTYFHSLFEKDFGPTEKDALIAVRDRMKEISRRIKSVIEPVTIRRNRLDLLNNPAYKTEVDKISKVKDPVEWFFELTQEQSDFYDSIIQYYFAPPNEGGKFTGAIYKPVFYERDVENLSDEEYDELTSKEANEIHLQNILYETIRRTLIKRFESSFGAFVKSVEHFKEINTTVLDFVERTHKFILDRKLIERLVDEDENTIEEELEQYALGLKSNTYKSSDTKVYEVDKFKYKDKFLNDIKSDIKLFEEVANKMATYNLKDNDPKAKCLVEKLREQLKKEPIRKIVIFSEYKDTVSYLKSILDKEFPNRVLTVEGQWTDKQLEEIYTNFDASYPRGKDNYDILLATDKLSEGFNLNRAGMVVNYDIPWNPVRVIQRMGRINRIGKKVFDELYIVNFFPTEQGAEYVKSREIAAHKMLLIHNTLGEDAKIFDPGETPTPSSLYNRIQQNPDEMEGESFYTKVAKEFDKIEEEHPEVIKSISEEDFPLRVKVAKQSSSNELLVFVKKSNLYVGYAELSKEKALTREVPFEDALPKIKCEFDEKALPLSDKFWDAYMEIKHKNIQQENSKHAIPPLSLEKKASDAIQMLLARIDIDAIYDDKKFLQDILEDIRDYGTLPDDILRRVSKFDVSRKDKLDRTIKEIEEIKEEVGEDFLDKEKRRQKKLDKEIIVAVENRNMQEGGNGE